MTWEDSLKVFHHIYSKEHEGKRGKKKMKVRDEIQEHPNKPLRMLSWINHMTKVKCNHHSYC
jgi:hypothetical protein